MIYKAKGNVIFGDVNLLDFGAYAIYCNTFERPLRDTTRITVPGRNGELIFDNGRYQDTPIEYTIIVGGQDNTRNLLAALLTITGFARLEDSYDAEVYTMARINAAPMVDKQDDGGCRFSIKLMRKPQRFLKLGEQSFTITSTGTVYNPTLYNSLPFIRAYGNGTLTIGSQVITVAGVTDAYIDIDSDVQNASYGTANRNDKLTLNTGAYPELLPGQNNIVASGFSSVVIAPRWWTL